MIRPIKKKEIIKDLEKYIERLEKASENVFVDVGYVKKGLEILVDEIKNGTYKPCK